MRTNQLDVWTSKPPVGAKLSPQWVADHRCVGFWPFNENAGTLVNDASGLGNFGTYVNAASPQTQWIAGKKDSELNFSEASSQYVQVSNPAFFESFHNNLSVLVWYTPAANLSSYPGLVSCDAMGSSTGWLICQSASTLKFCITSPSLTGIVNPTAETQGKPTFGAATLTSGGAATIYNKFGLSVATGSVAAVAQSTNGLYFGADLGLNNTPTGANYNGSLRLVVICRGVLPVTAIRQMLLNPWAGFQAPSTRRWFVKSLAASAVVQRKTLSPLGTRVGSRQIQGIGS